MILINKKFLKNRTGTVVCKTDVNLITISKEGYDRVIGVYERLLLEERLDFLRQFSFMSKVPNSHLMSLLLGSKIK